MTGYSTEEQRSSNSFRAHLIIHFQFYLRSHFNVSQTAGKIIAFFAISKFICTILIDQNEPGIRKQSKPKLKASLNVKIGQGIVNICFQRPAS